MPSLVQGWFDVRELEPGVVVIGEPLHHEDVKSYLVTGSTRAVLIDTGMGVGDLKAVIDDLTTLPVTVVNSHAHWDHVGGNWRFGEIAIHRAEADHLRRGVPRAFMRAEFAPDRLRGPLPAGVRRDDLAIPPSHATRRLEGGEVFDLGGCRLEVMHAPGHSPGGIVLLERTRGILFSTDVAYAGPLYCQFADANLDDYRRTMAVLADLAPMLRVVYPSHNETPISPAILPKMRDALEAIATGRMADATANGVARHVFADFEVLVPAPASHPA